MNFRGRSFCGQVGFSDVGNDVHLFGWVDALRDHGDVIFIHLRDQTGIVQVVFSPEFSAGAVCKHAAALRSEFCITVSGRVIERASGTENPAIETGNLEVVAGDLTILSTSRALPFPISEKAMVAGSAAPGAEAVSEELRLQYRYLDLRRPAMQDLFVKRHRINTCVREYLDTRGFVEVETPMLTKSTPEGARDYLVPSRHHPKHFYALPQSPQLFKQLLMISGFDRYYQITRCFRDEDLRPNRQPEFTQLDIEAAFIDETFIFEIVEALLVRMFAVGGTTLPRPFPRITWHEAMETTGTDKPDLRFGLRFVEATDIFTHTHYSIFKQILHRGGTIKGFNVKGASGQLSKNVLQNEYAKDIVPGFGAKGMTWMRVTDGKLDSNIVQFFSEAEACRVMELFGAQNDDVILMIADPSRNLVNTSLGQLRLHVARRLGLIPQETYYPVWVTDFPLFEVTDDGISPNHHPFTAPDRNDFDPENSDDLMSLMSRSYDIVVNGEELGGGSIRIHQKDLQQKIFQALRLSDQEVKEKFGFFLKAFEYGAPPHGGVALGMDRVVSMILKTASIREVTAFPKNRSAFCPLTQAPAEVAYEQLAELGFLDIRGKEEFPGASHQKDRIDNLSWVLRIGILDGERPAIESAVADALRMVERIHARAGDTEPTFCVYALENRFRNGISFEVPLNVETDELFKNAPAVKGDFFKVPTIIE
ncbi:MAG: aspartate--tRNA ligase [Deltaproteobacteria bacterium]|nr:aspartate--tRNA ligase [Deltaproteobacteria bacterium]